MIAMHDADATYDDDDKYATDDEDEL